MHAGLVPTYAWSILTSCLTSEYQEVHIDINAQVKLKEIQLHFSI